MSERRRIGLREVRALGRGEIVWDSGLPGFAARRQRSEMVSYVLKYRTSAGQQRWHTIGRHGAPWTPETARAEALRVLGDVAKGADPASANIGRRTCSLGRRRRRRVRGARRAILDQAIRRRRLPLIVGNSQPGSKLNHWKGKTGFDSRAAAFGRGIVA